MVDIQSTDLVNVDWTFGGLGLGLVGVDYTKDLGAASPRHRPACCWNTRNLLGECGDVRI